MEKLVADGLLRNVTRRDILGVEVKNAILYCTLDLRAELISNFDTLNYSGFAQAVGEELRKPHLSAAELNALVYGNMFRPAHIAYELLSGVLGDDTLGVSLHADFLGLDSIRAFQPFIERRVNLKLGSVGHDLSDPLPELLAGKLCTIVQLDLLLYERIAICFDFLIAHLQQSIAICFGFRIAQLRQSIEILLREDRARIAALSAGDRICQRLLSARAVMAHKVNLRLALFRRPARVCLFWVKLHTGDRDETEVRIQIHEVFAVAVELCPAVGECGRQQRIQRAATAGLGIFEHPNDISVRGYSQTRAAICAHEQRHVALCKAFCVLWRDSPAVSGIGLTRGRKRGRKNSGFRGEVFQLHNGISAVSYYSLFCFA